MSECSCVSWARAGVDPYKIKTRTGLPLITNHHPNCPHYNDSLMDVWKMTVNGSTCYFDNEQDVINAAQEEFEDETTITKQKMHREVFESLPEFEGF